MPRLWEPIHRFISGQYSLPTLAGAVNSNAYLLTIFQLFFGGHLLVSHVGSVMNTLGPSMLPTLNVSGDWVYISKLHRRGLNVRVGDVVSVKHPLFPEASASKRVLGMPGDYVLRDSPRDEDGKSRGRMSRMIQVPEGHCWLAGDNLPQSRDSRDYGPLPLALIKGKVVARVWPPRQIKWMENTLEPAYQYPRS